MDKMTPEQRHKCMASIRSRDTKPEKIVRRYLFKMGMRFRLNHPRLPGHPDIVMRKFRTVIFVNGCFWHGHDECGSFKMPKTNVEFWQEKIARNKKRDATVRKQLAEMGWNSLVVWECQLKPASRETTLRELVNKLNAIYLNLLKPRSYSLPQEELPMAAESPEVYGDKESNL